MAPRPINPANISLRIQDILTNYGGPDIGRAIAQNLIDQSNLGVGNVLRLEERDVNILDDSGSITGTRRALQAVFNLTGQAFDDIGEAIQFANARGVVSYTRISGRRENKVGRQLPMGGLFDDMRKINIDIIKRAKQNPNGKIARDLRKLGLSSLIDDAELESRNGQRVLKDFLEIKQATVKIPYGSTADDYLMNFTNTSGKLMGTLLEGDDGFTFYQYSFPGKELLDQDQILKLRAYAGLPEMDTTTVIDSLKAGVDPNKGLESKIMKAGKRQKGTYSPRQLSVSGKGIKAFLSGASPAGMADAVLVVDTRAELLLAGLSRKVTDAALGDSLRGAFNALDYNFYGTLDSAEQNALTTFERILGKNVKKSDYNEMARILDNLKGSPNLTKDFEKAVKNSTNLNTNIKSRIEVMLGKMEIQVDGALRQSTQAFQKYADSLQKTYDGYNTKRQSLIASGADIDKVNAVSKEIDDVEKTLKSFAKRGKDGKWLVDQDIYGMTARINYREGTRTPQVKGRSAFVDKIITKSGREYAFVSPDVNVKREVRIPSGIFMDVLGRDKGIEKMIAPDIQSLVQYSSSFIEIDPVTGKGVIPKITRMHVERVKAELDEVIRTKNVPIEVMQAILQKLETNEEAEFESVYKAGRRGARINQQMGVKAMRNALMSGNWNNEVLNAIFNEYMSQTMSYKAVQSSGRTKTFIIPKTPELYRFDIESEPVSLMSTDKPRMLEGSRDTLKVRMGPPEFGGNDISLPVTRISQHRMLFSAMNAVQYQAAHGGFDFDDKGMPIIRSYVDTNNGQKRLALFTFRQPPSIGEYTVQAFLKDQETLNSLFSKNKNFKDSLRALASEDDEAAELLRYMEMNPTDIESGKTFAELHKKFAGVDVSISDISSERYYGTQRTARIIQEGQSGFSTFQEGQLQADRVIIKAYERALGAAPSELSSFVMKSLNITKSGATLSLTPEVFSKLSSAEKLEAAPAYLQGNVFRLFAESKEVPFSIEERSAFDSVMRKYRISSPVKSDANENAYRRGMSDIFNILQNDIDSGNNRVALAEMNAIVSKYKLRLTMAEKGGILGSYINTLTALGSTVEQYDDITAQLRKSGMGDLADIVDKQLAAFTIGSESAIDFTKAAGGMKIRGVSDAAQSNVIAKAISDAYAVHGGSLSNMQLASILENLGVSNIDEGGTQNIFNVGKRIGMFKTMGEMFELDYLKEAGIDQAMFQRSLTGRRAIESLRAGLLAGAESAISIGRATDEQRARGQATKDSFENISDRNIQTSVQLATNSRYAAFSVQTEYGKSIQDSFGAMRRDLLLDRRASEIDSFFYKSQNDIMPKSMTDMAFEIVDSFKANFDEIEKFRKEQRAATEEMGGVAEGQHKLSTTKLAQDFEKYIKESVEQLQRQGLENITDIDLADAIAYAGRVKRVGMSSLEDFAKTGDPRIGGYIPQLFEDAELRREYFTLATHPRFKSSESYKLQQVMDRALGRLSPQARTKVESELEKIDDIYGFLRRIADRPNSIKNGRVAGSTLNELIDGIMTIDDFNRIVGKSIKAKGSAAIGSLADEDYGFMRLTEPGRKASKANQKMFDDIIAMSTDDDFKEIQKSIDHSKNVLGDLSKIYRARKRGFEEKYLTSSGDIVMPTLGQTGARPPGSAQAIEGQKYRRLSSLIEDGTIKNLMQKPYMQSTAIGIAGLAAFGLIYSTAKDRTPEDMQGPPLLPGGSSYETAYPGNTLNLPIPQDLLASSQNGVTYKVNVSGDSDSARRFSEAARTMSSGSSSVNYYSGIQDLSKDPYRQIAESF